MLRLDKTYITDRGPVLDASDYRFPDRGILQIRSRETSHLTLFLRTIVGLQAPDAGRVWFEDRDVYADAAAAKAIRLRSGAFFEDLGLLFNLSLAENLTLPLVYHGLLSREATDEWVGAELDRAGIYRWRTARPATLPTEIRILGGLLRALILKPKLLVLDEPTRGLSPGPIQQLEGLLDWHRQNAGLELVLIGSRDETLLGGFPDTRLDLELGRLRIDAPGSVSP